MHQPRLLPAVLRPAVDNLRLTPRARRSGRLRHDGCASAPASTDTIRNLLRAGLLDLHSADMAFFEQWPERAYRLRPAFWMELCGLGFGGTGRPFLLLPPGTKLFTVTPRSAKAGLADRRFVVDDDDHAVDLEDTDRNLEVLWQLGDEAGAFCTWGRN